MLSNIEYKLECEKVNPELKQNLKSKAHALKPVVLLGAKGLTTAVVEEIDVALQAHELIKIKLNGVERDERRLVAESICEQLSAELIQLIGAVIVIYKKNISK